MLRHGPAQGQRVSRLFNHGSGAQSGHDTVGAVARDRYGNLAAALIDSLRAHGCGLPVEVFYLGPSETYPAHQVYVPAGHKLRISAHVSFDETVFPSNDEDVNYAF